MYLQGRDMNWESTAGTSALVRYAPSICAMLLLCFSLNMLQPAHVGKATVLMLAATLYTSLALTCEPAPCFVICDTA